MFWIGGKIISKQRIVFIDFGLVGDACREKIASLFRPRVVHILESL